MKTTPLTSLTIKLANDEYDGQPLKLEEYAKWGWNMYPDCDVMHISEHGGWWLTFARDEEGNPFVIETANDTAQLSRKAKDFWNDHCYCPRQYLPDIDRNTTTNEEIERILANA